MKSVDCHSLELKIHRLLISNPSSSNHTVPTELIACGETELILMPFLPETYMFPWRSVHEILAVAEQYLEVLLAI